MPRQLLIHSHRGLDFGPENTLLAFGKALAAGCGLELDVRLTKDGKIAIIHDSDLQHGAGVPDKISELTMAQIQRHGLFGTEEHVPSFDELATLLKQFKLPQDAIAVHLKLGEQTEPMMELLADKIAEHGLEDVMFIFDVARPAIDFLKARNSKLRLAISLGAEHHAPTIFTMDDLSKFADVPIIWWDEWGQAAGKLYSQENLAPFKERGLKVYVISPDVAYQTNHPLAHDNKYLPMWRKLIDWGVDGVCTDQSKQFIKFLKN